MKELFIGINGFAGSGKDTVAKMLKIILGSGHTDMQSCYNLYKSIFTNPTKSVTFDYTGPQWEYFKNYPVMCIAYADQLKNICSTLYGIPVERFYMNKSTAWICVNNNFEYTEIKPDDTHIITSSEFYCNTQHYLQETEKYWMSLREILVYVGTYVLQENINRNIFVNIVRNKIKEEEIVNKNLKYVIITDNRFEHELEFIRENNGITIQVVRDSVEQLDNIAEHNLDEEDGYDYIIENNKGYDELFSQVWNIVHNDVEFQNKTLSLYTRDNINNYLRLIDSNDEIDTYLLCTPLKVQNIYHSNGEIVMVNPTGGPIINVGEVIDGTKCNEFPFGLVVKSITFHDESGKFIIKIDKKFWENIPKIY